MMAYQNSIILILINADILIFGWQFSLNSNLQIKLMDLSMILWDKT